MKSNGAITATVTLLALAVSAVPPASANPLLSGYGGPGEGNQAILGSALLNGPSGGGSGSAGSSGSAAGAGLASAQAGGGIASARAGDGLASAGASGQAPSAADRGRRSAGAARKAAGNGSQTHTATPSSAASHGAVPGAQTLGISGADLLDIVLALGVLLATGALTRRLAYRPH
jgi:hypothetical protein